MSVGEIVIAVILVLIWLEVYSAGRMLRKAACVISVANREDYEPIESPDLDARCKACGHRRDEHCDLPPDMKQVFRACTGLRIGKQDFQSCDECDCTGWVEP